MVTVVGSPAQGQLAEIPGADDQSARLIGHVHEHLGPLPGLGVLIGDVLILRVVADVPEVTAHRVPDGDGPQGGPHVLRQEDGVVLRPLRGAEAGHGDGNDVTGVPVEHPHGQGGDQQGQGAVQAAGEPDDGRARAGVLQPLLQAQGGDGQDLLAPGGTVGGVVRDERGGGDIPAKLGDAGGELRRALIKGRASFGGEGGQAAAFIGQALHVDVRDGQPRGEAVFCQQRAVFRHHVVAGEHQIRGGLALPGIGVHIAAAQPSGLPDHQLAAVGGLAHHLVGGGEVQYHCGPRLRQPAGGRVCGP